MIVWMKFRKISNWPQKRSCLKIRPNNHSNCLLQIHRLAIAMKTILDQSSLLWKKRGQFSIRMSDCYKILGSESFTRWLVGRKGHEGRVQRVWSMQSLWRVRRVQRLSLHPLFPAFMPFMPSRCALHTLPLYAAFVPFMLCLRAHFFTFCNQSLHLPCPPLVPFLPCLSALCAFHAQTLHPLCLLHLAFMAFVPCLCIKSFRRCKKHHSQGDAIK